MSHCYYCCSRMSFCLPHSCSLCCLLRPTQFLVDPRTAPETNLKLNNPLSTDANSPWFIHFADMDLRDVINRVCGLWSEAVAFAVSHALSSPSLKDVTRTFPDEPYFELPQVQATMSDLLFLYAKMNPDIGYRQVWLEQ